MEPSNISLLIVHVTLPSHSNPAPGPELTVSSTHGYSNLKVHFDTVPNS